MNRNEESYYPEIMGFVKTQIESNFYAWKNPLKVYCKVGELQKGLHDIIRENNITTKSIIDFADSTPPLSLDIFALITDTISYELLIIEVKKMRSVGLTQLSQLIGYCVVAKAQYGLLVNVDGGQSPRLSDLLVADRDLTHIERILYYQMRVGQAMTRTVEHDLGVMEWDSITHNLTYSGHGGIRSMSDLCHKLSDRFSQ